MKKQDGAAFASLRRTINDVNDAAVDLDEVADRRMTPFDSSRPPLREEAERKKNEGEN